MSEPILVVMAAGMGSRYGGLKQMDPVSDNNELIIDFSVFDAIRAGFKKVIFIIKKEIEQDFKQVFGDRVAKHIQVEYAYQEISELPEGYTVPEGRVKPWGTVQAVLSCKNLVDGNFAVLNADDFYGFSAYDLIYKFLKNTKGMEFAMVSYLLENTLTEHGHVARGVCEAKEGFLQNIVERTHVELRDGQIQYLEDDKWGLVPQDSIVSMNFWGLTPDIFPKLEEYFKTFLNNELPGNPLKCECYLPNAIGRLLKDNEATVKVLESKDKWFGVTYKEDKERVVKAIANLKSSGAYPSSLWN